MFLRKYLFRIDPTLLLLFGLSLWALSTLLAPGFFFGAHDGRHSVFYTSMFHESILDGAWWPRWAMHHNQGYGYPTFVLQSPGAFYIAEFFILLGFGITNAVKLTFALGFLASGWGMYALVRYWLAASIRSSKRVNNRQSPDPSDGAIRDPQTIALAALVAGLLYVYAPYHLLDAYVRAALAETMLFAWLPWVFLAFERLISGGKEPGWQGRLLLAALSFAGLLLTHVFALLSVVPLLVVFILFRLWCAHRELQGFVVQTGLALAGGICAFLLTMIFVLPLLVEGPLLAQEVFTTGTYSYKLHWVQWGQFLSSFWGFGYSDDPLGANDGMGFQLGAMLAVFAICGLLLLLFKRLQGRIAWLLSFLLLASFATLFVMTPMAVQLWQLVPMLEVIQFPWRLLLLSSFLLSAVGGLVVASLLPMPDAQVPDAQMRLAKGKESEAKGGILLLGLLVIYASSSYLQPEALQPIEAWREDGRAVFAFEAEHPDMLGYTRAVESKFTQSPMSAQYAASEDSGGFSGEFSNADLQRLGVLSGEGEILSHYSRGKSFGGEVLMKSAGVIQVRVFDFPGWQVRLDSINVDHRVSPPYGLIEVDVPTGRHQLDVRMGSTPARSTGAAISGLTLLLLIGLWAWGKRGERGNTAGALR